MRYFLIDYCLRQKLRSPDVNSRTCRRIQSTECKSYRHRYLAQLLADAVLHDAPQVDAVVRLLWYCLTPPLESRQHIAAGHQPARSINARWRPSIATSVPALRLLQSTTKHSDYVMVACRRKTDSKYIVATGAKNM